MHFSLCAALLVACGAVSALDPFANVTVYQPDDANTQVTYARTESLPNNTVIAAWNDPSQTTGTLAIYQSIDSGFSWYPLGSITSDTAGRRLTQPFILYVNAAFGNYDAGSVLVAVNAVDSKSTNIEIYASQDNGTTFALASSVVSGGPSDATSGTAAVSEPFLLYNDPNIVCYYTQRGQKISHRTTSGDFDSFGSAIDDVATQNSTSQPGASSVAKLPNGQFIMTYEYGQRNATGQYNYPVYYKLASNPENFGAQPAQRLVVNSGVQPNRAPYVTWSSLGGTNGSIVVSDSSSSSLFVNTDLGANVWEEVKTAASRAYSREVKIPNNDNTKLRVSGGAEYGQNTQSQILVTVLDLAKALGIVR